MRRQSCLSTSNVPHSIDLDSVGSDISDIHEKNVDFEGLWIKHMERNFRKRKKNAIESMFI